MLDSNSTSIGQVVSIKVGTSEIIGVLQEDSAQYIKLQNPIEYIDQSFKPFFRTAVNPTNIKIYKSAPFAGPVCTDANIKMLYQKKCQV